MGDKYRSERKFQYKPSNSRIQDMRPGKRSQIRVKSEQLPPPLKRYGGLPPEVPWPDRNLLRKTLGENYREQLESLNKIGEEQPGPVYRKTAREIRRAELRKSGPGKITDALKTAVKLPGLPDGSPSSKSSFTPKTEPKLTSMRSGPPRGVGGLGFAIEVWKDRERIWEEASMGKLGRFHNLRIFKSWLTTQPVGTTIPGDMPVKEALGRFISDVGSKERVEKGDGISSELFAWRKEADGYWHLIPAPAAQLKAYAKSSFLPEKYLPKWFKGQDGHWHLQMGSDQKNMNKTPTLTKQQVVPPPAFSGARATATGRFGYNRGIGGKTSGLISPKPGLQFPRNTQASNLQSKSHLISSTNRFIDQYKPKTIFDTNKLDKFGPTNPTRTSPHPAGQLSSGSGTSSTINDIRSRFRPKPVGGALPKISHTTGQRSGSGFHVVQSGEVLSRIANQYGTSVSAFAHENQWLLNRHGKILKGVDYIRPGDRLKIPGFNH